MKISLSSKCYMNMIGIALGIFIKMFILMAIPAQAAVPDILSVPIVADVTTRSLSVIWVVDANDADPHIYVYNSPSGTPGSPSDITSTLTLEPMPVSTGNSSQTFADIQAAAQARGIQKIRVLGLNFNTTYYYQIYSSNGDGNSSLFPASPDPVSTELQTSKTKLNGLDIVPFSNELMVVELFDETGADLNGGIVLVNIVESGASGNYPVSAFVGDGIDSPFAMIDINNVFGDTSHENMDCLGGERMDLLVVRGSNCPQEQIKYRIVPSDDNLDEAKLLTPCYNYDSDPKCTDNDCSGFISMMDVQNILDLLGSSLPECEYNDDFDVNPSDFISMMDVQEALDQLGQTCD